MSNEVRVNGNLVPVSSIAWVMDAGLTRRERLYRPVLFLAALVMFFVIAYATGTILSLHSVLALLPALLAARIQARCGVACSGDSSATYLRRRPPASHALDVTTRQLEKAGLLSLSGPGDTYRYVVNVAHLHYVRPWTHFDRGPIALAAIFAVYALAIHGGGWGVLHVLPGRAQALQGACLAGAILGLLGIVATWKQGLKVGCDGGAVEQLRLDADDRRSLLGALDLEWDDSIQAPVSRSARGLQLLG